MCFLALVSAACGCAYPSGQLLCACNIILAEPVSHYSTSRCPDCTRLELDIQERAEAGLDDSDGDSYYEDFLESTQSAFDDVVDGGVSSSSRTSEPEPAEQKPVATGDRSNPWESTSARLEMSTIGTTLYGAEPLPEINEDGEVQWVFVQVNQSCLSVAVR